MLTSTTKSAASWSVWMIALRVAWSAKICRKFASPTQLASRPSPRQSVNEYAPPTMIGK